MRVLIVEDNDTVRTTLEKLLAQEGFAVQSAATLKEGTAKLDHNAAVVLDLELPDGSGVDLLASIRREHKPVMVLVATATTDADLLDAVRRLRPDALLTKPVDLRHLIHLLDPSGRRH
jgi:DNA-binding response OmpR family regulator